MVDITVNGKGTDFYLRSFYGRMSSYRKSSERGGTEASTLAAADAAALRSALRQIEDTTEDDVENTRVKVSAFAEAYNNMMDASKDLDDDTVIALRKKIVKLAENNADALEEIGITVRDDGTFKVTESHLKDAVYSKIEALFGSEASFSKKLSTYQKNLGNASEEYAISRANKKAQQKRLSASSAAKQEEENEDDDQLTQSVQAAVTAASFSALQSGSVDMYL